MEQTEIKKPQSQFQRAVNIVTSPMKAIEAIQEKPNYLLPLIIIWAIGIISLLLTKDLASQLMDISYQNAGMTADQIATTKEAMSGYMTVMMVIGIIVMPLAPLVKGCVSHLISIMFSGEGKIGSTVSLMLNAYLIPMFGTLLALPMMLITQNGAFSFSPAILLPITKFGTPIFNTLSTLNIFTIWYLVVSVMGIKKIHNLETWKAVIIVLVPFVVVIAFSWVGVLMGSPSGL